MHIHFFKTNTEIKQVGTYIFKCLKFNNYIILLIQSTKETYKTKKCHIINTYIYRQTLIYMILGSCYSLTILQSANNLSELLI